MKYADKAFRHFIRYNDISGVTAMALAIGGSVIAAMIISKVFDKAFKSAYLDKEQFRIFQELADGMINERTAAQRAGNIFANKLERTSLNARDNKGNPVQIDSKDYQKVLKLKKSKENAFRHARSIDDLKKLLDMNDSYAREYIRLFKEAKLEGEELELYGRIKH